MGSDTPPGRGSLCKGNCSEDVAVFFHFASGKSRLTDIPAQDVERALGRSAVRKQVVGPAMFIDRAAVFTAQVRRAYFDGLRVTNCFVCRYHGTGVEKAVYCKRRRVEVPSHAAAECSDFHPFASAAACAAADGRNAEFVRRYTRIVRPRSGSA
jgi:hypothetical protein